MNISHDRLLRHLARSEELFRDEALPPLLKTFYTQRLAEPTARFRAAHRALEDAENAAAKERSEVRAALDAIARPYQLVRVLIAANAPERQLPSRFGALKTDTDKKLALSALLHVIDDCAALPWAAGLDESEFAERAPEVIRELEEDTHARSSLYAAVKARAATFGPAMEAFMSFRAAVRAGLGANTSAYRRIAPTPERGGADDDEGEADD